MESNVEKKASQEKKLTRREFLGALKKSFESFVVLSFLSLINKGSPPEAISRPPFGKPLSRENALLSSCSKYRDPRDVVIKDGTILVGKDCVLDLKGLGIITKEGAKVTLSPEGNVLVVEGKDENPSLVRLYKIKAESGGERYTIIKEGKIGANQSWLMDGERVLVLGQEGNSIILEGDTEYPSVIYLYKTPGENFYSYSSSGTPERRELFKGQFTTVAWEGLHDFSPRSLYLGEPDFAVTSYMRELKGEYPIRVEVKRWCVFTCWVELLKKEGTSFTVPAIAVYDSGLPEGSLRVYLPWALFPKFSLEETLSISLCWGKDGRLGVEVKKGEKEEGAFLAAPPSRLISLSISDLYEKS